jgi:hypothetical protein
MRKSVLWLAPLFLGAAFLLSAYGGGDDKYASGSPGGYSGSPGDGQNCHACHGGSVANVSGWITSNIPIAGYTPGTIYTITATATGSGRKGFEISPQTPSGSLVGTLTASSGNHLCNSSKAVTQSSGVNSNPAIWTFSWTAPAAGTGSVTFYGAFAVTSSATKLTTMVVNEASSIPLTATATATPSTIYTGQTSQLSVVVAGGTGSYTYSWVSNPAGFTSSLQNPVVSPAVTTTYSVTVTSGTSTANSSVTVTVLPTVPIIATATASPASVCAGQTSQLNVSATGGIPPYTYFWTSNPAGFTSSLQDPIVTPAITTIYSVQVSDGINSTNSSVTVTVTPAPAATAGIDTTYCKDVASIPLHGTASGYASVAWTTSGNGTFSSTSSLESNYLPGTNDRNGGSVDLTLTASPVSPCAVPALSVRHIIFDPCTGLNGKPAMPEITVEPNPTTGILYIGCTGSAGSEVYVVIFNDHGQQVLSRNIRITGQKGILDLSGLAKGLYYVKALAEEKTFVSKVILY